MKTKNAPAHLAMIGIAVLNAMTLNAAAPVQVRIAERVNDNGVVKYQTSVGTISIVGLPPNVAGHFEAVFGAQAEVESNKTLHPTNRKTADTAHKKIVEIQSDARGRLRALKSRTPLFANIAAVETANIYMGSKVWKYAGPGSAAKNPAARKP